MFFPEDPQKQAMMMMALGLLGGAPQGRKNFGADLAHGGLLGMQGLQSAQQFKMRQDEERQQREMRQAQLDEMKRLHGVREKMAGAAQRNIIPGQPQMQPTDYETPSGPAGPSSFNMQGYAQDLFGAGPEGIQQGIGLLAQLQKQNAPIKLGRDDRLLDPTTRREIVPAAPDKPPAGFTRGTDGGLSPDPKWLETQMALRAAGRPQVSVNTNMPPLERREQGDKGALNVKNYGDMQGAANAARKELALLTGIEKLDLSTSKFTPLNSALAGWAVGMGASQEALRDLAAKGQSFTAFTKDLVLQRQLAQKGPQTESDAQRLEQTSAQLGNTTEANQLIVAFGKAQNKRIVEQEKFYGDWWKKHKTFEGADDAWFSGKGGSSLWDEPELKKFGGKVAGGAANDPLGIR